MKLSIVTTLYQSAPYILEFYERASGAAKQLVGQDYEIIMVNDGSPDNSLDVAVGLTRLDEHLLVVDLSRNFGHHKAMMTGLAHARGDRVFLIDSDLEEEPEWLLVFSHTMKDEASDVVFGVQKTRKGGRFEMITGLLFYRLFRVLTGVNQPDNIVTARLMSSRYKNALISHGERELNIGGLWIITGFKQSKYTVEKYCSSPTTYSFHKKIDIFMDAITSFSSLPLKFVFYLGLTIVVSIFLYIGYIIFLFLYSKNVPSGYTSILISIWFFSGLIIFFMGLQGIYISKIYSEVKQRPYTIIRAIYSKSSK